MTTTLYATNTVFRAFADPTRLRLLNLLSEGELCVCELVELLGMVQPKISRHLAYLRRARLVAVRQEGKWKYYSLPRSTEGLHRTLLECVRSCLREMDILQEDLARLAESGGRCECE